MKTLLIKFVFVGIVAIVAGINVFNAKRAEVLSDVAIANIEALANGELRPGIYDILEEITTFAVDGVPYKETRIINCVLGGQYDCQAGNYWRHWTNGGWSDWFYV